MLECYPNECHNYGFKMIVDVLWILLLKTTIVCHRKSDLNVDSIRVTGENEINDFIPDFKIETLKNARNIMLGLANINGVRNKFGPIEGIFINGLIDILVTSESKRDGSFQMAQFIVENYTPHREDRNSKWNGLMIYIRSAYIPHRRRADIENTDMMVCELQLYTDEMFLCACYKPPWVREKKNHR